jgi:hypothetical protein
VSSAIDVNPLVYASDTSSPFHEPALAFVERLAAGRELVYLFWPTALAYLRIATHPSIFARPLSSRQAVANLTSLLGLPHVRSPGEDAGFWTAFGTVVGGIWTRDRDFLKFDGVRVLDPFAPR